MDNERKEYYEKITDLLLSVQKRIYGDNYIKASSLSDRQNRILLKNYGEEFSREKVLFLPKFLIFAPSFVATPDALYFYRFEEDLCKNHILKFNNVKEIKYSLMPLKTEIHLTMCDGRKKLLYNGTPNAQTYDAAKRYEKSVMDGTYKNYTIWILICIYTLTALKRSKQDEWNKTYLEIEKNINNLLEYQKAEKSSSQFYGDFCSFDFVTCSYNSKEVEDSLNFISQAIAEARAERQDEIVTGVQNFVESEMKRTQREMERTQKKIDQNRRK